MAAETEARRLAAGPAPALADGAGVPAALRSVLADIVARLAPELLSLSHDLHAHPEVGHEEHHAMAAVAGLLRAHGIEPELGVFGMETALRASIGPVVPAGISDGAAGAVGGTASSNPGTIAILAEYDALPGIGHACGHNVMCANSVGAFLALAALEAERPGSLPGAVVLTTTPAEECSTAKEALAQAGMLDGIDAAIQTHSYAADVTHQTWLGQRRMRVTYHGIPAHASSQPFMGRNALDAATLALTGIGLLRQQILPMDRIHAVVTHGGDAANIIPERAELNAFIRSKDLTTLRDLVARVEDVFRGAALMTGTGVEITPDPHPNEMPVRDNAALLASWVRAQRERGREPLPAGVLPETIAAGTDFGNVSQRVPGIHPLIKITTGGDVALHTPAMAEAAGSPTGDAACLDGAYGLASVALDWLHDAEVREAARADFEATGGTVDVASFWDE
ncbi:amidohydrolase [Actinomyces marmotae]|uniref:amidohydrolase n=1 Tax=Actinomyces marmotae TaxID=2737173 RepID=UPI001F16E411|nr:amidohydrolase [Actinomyces marmotae]